jgi:hypothetical protein
LLMYSQQRIFQDIEKNSKNYITFSDIQQIDNQS